MSRVWADVTFRLSEIEIHDFVFVSVGKVLGGSLSLEVPVSSGLHPCEAVSILEK